MTKTQLRELQTLLTVLASRLRPDREDDAVRLLLYRARKSTEEQWDDRSVRRAVSRAS